MKKISRRGLRAVERAGGRKGRRMMRFAHTHSHHLPRVQRNTGNLFPQVGSCVTSRRLQSTAILLPASPSPRFLPPSRPDPMQYTTLAYHTYFILKHRTERAYRDARTRVHVSSYIQGEPIIKFSSSDVRRYVSFSRGAYFSTIYLFSKFYISPIEFKMLKLTSHSTV